MADAHATITYSIAQPFDEAVKLVRGALSGTALRITGELNLSGRIHKKLLIGTAPCLVLFASPPKATTESQIANPIAGTLHPLHIVVSGRGSHTDIHILRVLPRDGGPVDRNALSALGQLQTAILKGIEKIAMRSALGG